MMPKKEDEKRMDTLVLHRRVNKITTEGDTETKGRTESEGKTIQRLPQPRVASHIQLENPDIITHAHSANLYCFFFLC